MENKNFVHIDLVIVECTYQKFSKELDELSKTGRLTSKPYPTFHFKGAVDFLSAEKKISV